MSLKYIVFLPVRNGSRYLESALDSIFGQTRTDWHLVVLENQSLDDTEAILEKKSHPSMTVVRAQSPLSITESWARVGRYIEERDLGDSYCTVIGHDDLLMPTFLESIDDLIQREPGASLYQTLFDLIDENDHLIRQCRPIPERETGVDFVAARCWGLRDSFGTGYVFRGADYLAVGGIPLFPRLLYADDLLFARLSRIAYKACTTSIECSYRLHRASASSSLSVDLYEASVEAIGRYVAVIEEEWSSFAVGPLGSSALAALLAREVMIFSKWPLNGLLDKTLRLRVAALASLFGIKSRGVPFERWLGSNFVAREGYLAVKLTFLSLLFVRERLRRTTRSSKSV